MNKIILTLFVFLITLPAFADQTSDFFAAVRAGDRAQAKTLLRKNQNLAQTTDKKGQTPFLVAVTQKDLQMVYLLAPFSALSAAGPRGNAFHIAAQNEDEPMLKLLMQITTERNKALPQKMLNAQRNREDEMSLTSSDGNTPLHVAAKMCNTRIYNYFTHNGADDSIENEYGQTPLKILTACQKQKAWEADYKKKQAAKKAKNK